MSDSTLSDRALVILFAISVLTYGLGDVLSTYIALNFHQGTNEGVSVTAGLISSGLDGYALLLALKLIGLLMILGIAFFGWRIAAKWLLLGFAVYGSYLTASNLCVFFFGSPLLPPGNPYDMLQFIWMMVLPFLVIGIALETLDTIKILNGEKEGHGIWGQRLKRWDRRSVGKSVGGRGK
jgi:hypothetical protein